jgi:glycosyltransferase involved in cell wall biosynthesis
VKKHKILINTTPPENLGGVANHYQGLKTFWTENVMYNYIGHRNRIPGSVIIIYDLFKFVLKLIYQRPDVVILNPSLGFTALFRDGLYLILTLLFRINSVVFIHGWDKKMEQKIDSYPFLFSSIFNRTSKILVLSEEFRQKLMQWGITTQINLTTTKVDDKLIGDWSPEMKTSNHTLLYLARIEKEKGIFTTLNIFDQVIKELPNAELVVAGDGSDLMDAKRYVKEKKIPNVNFVGYLRGTQIQEVFRKATVYIFPTSYGEGMPTSVLEAMAFGLPVLTSPIGGLNDFFEDSKMGFLINPTDTKTYVEKVIWLLTERDTWNKISQLNFTFAKDHLYASVVSKKLEIEFKLQ